MLAIRLAHLILLQLTTLNTFSGEHNSCSSLIMHNFLYSPLNFSFLDQNIFLSTLLSSSITVANYIE
jgi:hypothetical protein